ncbi:MAG: hypothetical protein K6D02_07835 [Lachnospiraceae bacterium]|nr:hypothetical protein [Lachnospiraceae bacterium]
MKKIFIPIFVMMVLVFPTVASANSIPKVSHDSFVSALLDDEKLISTLDKYVESTKDSAEPEDVVKSYDLNEAWLENMISLGVQPNKQWKESKTIENLMTEDNFINIPAKNGNDENILLILKENYKNDNYDIQQAFDTSSENISKDAKYSEMNRIIEKSDLKADNFIILYSFVYDMELLYFKDSSDQKYVIPYNGNRLEYVDIIGLKEGKAYKENTFMESLCNAIEDYSDEEVEEYNKKELIGSSLPVKIKKQAQEKYKKKVDAANEKAYKAMNTKDSNINMKFILPASVILIIFIVLIIVIYALKKKHEKTS